MDNIFNYISWNENYCTLIKILLKLLHKDHPIDKSTLVLATDQVWRWYSIMMPQLVNTLNEKRKNKLWNLNQSRKPVFEGNVLKKLSLENDDVVKWINFPQYWPFVQGIHRSPVNSLHKGQWHGSLMLSLICAWINGWLNNREAGDLGLHRAHYDVTVMSPILFRFHGVNSLWPSGHISQRPMS